MYIKNSFTDPVFHHKLSVQTLLRSYFSRSKIGAPVGAKAEAFELMCIVWTLDPSDQRIMHLYVTIMPHLPRLWWILGSGICLVGKIFTVTLHCGVVLI